MAFDLKRFPDREDWCQAVSERICELLREGVASRSVASLVVSGGRTPEPIFRLLNSHELPWSRIHVTLADERWVGPDDPASNERLVRQTLFSGLTEGEFHFHSLWREQGSAAEAVSEIETALAELPRPFNAVVLGMGDDGHTASLFPGQPETEQGLKADSVVVANVAPVAPRERISLSVGALCDTQEILIPIVGENKLSVLNEALQEGPALDMPIRAFLRQQTVPVSVFWSP